jgi:hypothetical protein
VTDRANNFGLAVAGGLMMVFSFAFAGERTDAQSGAPQALEAGAQMQKLVNALSGRWSINKTDANGTTAHGEEVWRTGAGGLPLVEEFRVTTSKGKELADYAAIWWDDQAKKYRGIWCADFTDQACTPFDVVWSGTNIEMRGEYHVKGQHFVWRELFELTEHDSFTQTLELAPADGELKKVSTVHGTKIGKE